MYQNVPKSTTVAILGENTPFLTHTHTKNHKFSIFHFTIWLLFVVCSLLFASGKRQNYCIHASTTILHLPLSSKLHSDAHLFFFV